MGWFWTNEFLNNDPDLDPKFTDKTGIVTLNKSVINYLPSCYFT